MPNPSLDPDHGGARRGAERNRDPGADPEREGPAMRVEEEPPS
jgi:hypothetical protein